MRALYVNAWAFGGKRFHELVRLARIQRLIASKDHGERRAPSGLRSQLDPPAVIAETGQLCPGNCPAPFGPGELIIDFLDLDQGGAGLG